MKKVWIYVLVAVIVVVIVGIMISKSEPATTPTSTKTEESSGEKTEAVIVEPVEPMDSPLGTFNPNNPQQTDLLDEATLPQGVVKFRASGGAFGPSEFNAVVGRVQSIVLLPSGESHSLVFEERPGLPKIRIEVGANEARGISFVAPEEPGDYTFYCDEPGHREAGETGVMHVL